jgi:hypothetical protein
MVITTITTPTARTIPSTTLNVKLTTDNNNLTLKHDREANLEITHDGNDNSFSSYRIDIKNENSGGWQTLSETKNFLWEATVADKFELRGVVVSNNTHYASPKIDVKVEFPEPEQIMNDPLVFNAMAQARANTLAFTEANNLLIREEGFYIQLDTASNEYIICNQQTGNEVLVSTLTNVPRPRISVQLPKPDPFDSIFNPTPLDKPIYTVGIFHTHPPTYFWPSGYSGRAGPGTNDVNAASNLKVPGFVYDYANPDSDGRLRAGHPIHAESKVYIIPPRRPLP